MVPKSRTLKGSRPPLKPFKVHYDTFFFSEKEENDRLDGLIKTYQENQHRQDDLLKEAIEEKDLTKLEENILFARIKYLEKIKVLPAKT
jgi:hypothetical protein